MQSALNTMKAGSNWQRHYCVTVVTSGPGTSSGVPSQVTEQGARGVIYATACAPDGKMWSSELQEHPSLS